MVSRKLFPTHYFFLRNPNALKANKPTAAFVLGSGISVTLGGGGGGCRGGILPSSLLLPSRFFPCPTLCKRTPNDSLVKSLISNPVALRSKVTA